MLAVFAGWERWLTGRGRIRPLIELRLFRSAGFTWGTTLSTLVSFAMFGIFFVMPQYFQEVRGADAMGSGLRLLPMIGGTRLAAPRMAAEGPASFQRCSRGTADSGTVMSTRKAIIAVAAAALGAGLSVGL